MLTGGIGENTPAVRARFVRDAARLGVDLDAAANDAGGPRTGRHDGRATASVMPTNEELIIARHTRRVLRADRAKRG